MNPFSGEGNYLGNNIPHGQGKVEQEQQIQKEKVSPNVKRILVIDDDPDITLTFKKGLEEENENDGNKIAFQVFTYNRPILALTEFKINFYDLLLIDANMPKMNGFEFSENSRIRLKRSDLLYFCRRNEYRSIKGSI